MPKGIFKRPPYNIRTGKYDNKRPVFKYTTVEYMDAYADVMYDLTYINIKPKTGRKGAKNKIIEMLELMDLKLKEKKLDSEIT